MVHKSQTHTANVSSLNGETGAVTLTSSGNTVLITTPTTQTINLEANVVGGVTSVNGMTGAVVIPDLVKYSYFSGF